MSTLRVALLTVSMCAIQACSRPASEQDRAQDGEALRALHVEATEIVRAGDAARWADMFTEGAILMAPDVPEAATKKEFHAFAQRQFDEYVWDITITPVEIEIAGGWAYSRTAVSGAGTPKAGGDAIQVDFKELAIWRREPDGSWKLWRLIGNNNRPSAFLRPREE
jgi:ketosteroid isomerase-like protein